MVLDGLNQVLQAMSERLCQLCNLFTSLPFPPNGRTLLTITGATQREPFLELSSPKVEQLLCWFR